MNDHYTIFSLGDSAATIELGKEMNEELHQKVLAMQKWFENTCIGLKDTVIAYSSLTVLYDPYIIRNSDSFSGSAYEWIRKKLEQAYRESSIQNSPRHATIRVPVCYDEEFGFDLADVSKSKNLSFEKIINLHVSRMYRVYMLGFLPGFAYLGEVDPILNMPRKQSPVSVAVGSIGIVSNQTGIYPVNSPGGWLIIGRTPLKLFEPQDQIPVKLKAGNKVQFYQITREEFEEFKD